MEIVLVVLILLIIFFLGSLATIGFMLWLIKKTRW